MHAGAQGYLPSKISFLAHKFIRFNRSSCAGGKTGWLIPGIVFNYCARITCLSMAYGIESFFLKNIKKSFARACLQSQMPLQKENYRAPDFSGMRKKIAPPRRQGAWQLFVVFYKSLFAEPFDPFLIHRPSVLLCNSPFYLFAHVVDGAYAVRLFFFHF